MVGNRGVIHADAMETNQPKEALPFADPFVIKALVSRIERALPDVVKAGRDLGELRALLDLQLRDASALTSNPPGPA
jgi:hypothetical protein